MTKLKLKRPKAPKPPASPLEAQAVDWVEASYRKLAPRVTGEISIADLERMLCDRLRQGDLEVIEKAVHAAENEGDEIADRCLRKVWRELHDARIEMSINLDGFGNRAVERAPLTRGPGAQTWHLDFKRDVLIATLVQHACLRFGLHKSRTRASRHERMPSGSSVVMAGVWRCGVKLSEDRVRKIYDGLAGLLAKAFIDYFSKT